MTTPHNSSRWKATPTRVVKRECSSESDSLFPLSDSRRKAQKCDIRCKLYENQCELEKLKLEAEDDAEESDGADNLCRSKTRAVYQECPIKPENFPGKNFNRWELRVKHYKSVVKSNGWSDMQAIEALPACLTSCDVEEVETVPRHYAEKVLGEKTLQFDAILEVLEPKMQQYRSKRAGRSEFKAVKQMETESLKDYFRRVRYLGDLALSKNHSKKEIRIYVISFWKDCSTFGCNNKLMKTKQTAIFAKFYTGSKN